MINASIPERKSHRVFLNYAVEDKEIAHSIADRLSHAGMNVVFDQYELTQADLANAKIQRDMSSSDYLLVLLSRNSVKSRWVRQELNIAFGQELATDKRCNFVTDSGR